MKKIAQITAMALLLGLGSHAAAVGVQITIMGTVDFNQIGGAPLGDANPGDAATISFQVDSTSFVDSATFPVRGYFINPTTFSFSAGSATVGLQDPFPAGQDPLFVIRNDDPAVDGFFLNTNTDGFPAGVPTDQVGLFSNFMSNFSVTYTGDTLSSLDILSALGTYDFTGLTVFGFTVDDGPFNAMGVIFDEMTISIVPVPAAMWLFASALLGLAGVRARSF